MPGVLNLYTFKIQDRDEREKERERECNVQLEMKQIYIYMRIKNMKHLWTELTYIYNTCTLKMKILLIYTKTYQNRYILCSCIEKDKYH